MKLSRRWIKCGGAKKVENEHSAFCHVTQICVSWYKEIIITDKFLVILAHGLPECMGFALALNDTTGKLSKIWPQSGSHSSRTHRLQWFMGILPRDIQGRGVHCELCAQKLQQQL